MTKHGNGSHGPGVTCRGCMILHACIRIELTRHEWLGEFSNTFDSRALTAGTAIGTSMSGEARGGGAIVIMTLVRIYRQHEAKLSMLGCGCLRSMNISMVIANLVSQLSLQDWKRHDRWDEDHQSAELWLHMLLSVSHCIDIVAFNSWQLVICDAVIRVLLIHLLVCEMYLQGIIKPSAAKTTATDGTGSRAGSRTGSPTATTAAAIAWC